MPGAGAAGVNRRRRDLSGPYLPMRGLWRLSPLVETREEMVDALSEEVLSEMAGTFFGARCSVDDEVELFEARAADLILAGQRVMSLVALLNEAFIDPVYAERFWKTLGVPEAFIRKADGVRASHYHAVPWGLSRRRRYLKLLERLYASLVLAVDRYRNGTDYTRPQEHRRSRLVGWHSYQQWADEINARIDSVNANQSPSTVLAFARSLDTQGAAKARVVGAGIDGFCSSVDDNLCLRHVDGSTAGIGPVPDFPEPAAALEAIRDVGNQVYAQEPRRVMALLDRLSRLAEVD